MSDRVSGTSTNTGANTGTNTGPNTATATGSTTAGRDVVQFDLAATIVFAITACYAAAVFSTTAQWVGATVAMGLFTLGVLAFMWSFWAALQLSRDHEVSVAEVYLLMGPGIPADIKRKMHLLIAAQFLIATVTSVWRPDGANGAPGSSLVVGFLVPMLGFGLNGIWATRHGDFAQRGDPRATDGRSPSTTTNTEIRQNAEHG